MDEIFQKLFESELLSESTKAELQEQWTTSVAAFKQEVREEVETDVRGELAEAFQTERDALAEKLDTFLQGVLEEEFAELRADIDRFHNHEAEQAASIVAMRKEMAVQVAEELDTLVDKLDTFLEKQVTEEFDELREGIEIAKESHFGRQIFEAFRADFQSGFADEKSAHAKLRIAESKLAKANAKAKALEADKQEMIRESKMSTVLQPLTGAHREQMELILKNVPNERLDETYKRMVGRVIRESTETRPLTESASTTQVKTGDKVTESAQAPKTTSQLSEAKQTQMRRMAGLI